MRATGRFAAVFDPVTGEAQAKAALASASEARAIVENAREAKGSGSPE